MRKFLIAAVAAAPFIGLGSVAATAGPIVFNLFDQPAGQNIDADWGTSRPFTSDGQSLAAYSGRYSGTSVILGGDNDHLFNNARGSNLQGLGVCVATVNACNASGDDELDGDELVQLDLNDLNAAGYSVFTVTANSIYNDDLHALWVYASASSNALGTLIAEITNANAGPVGIDTSDDRYLNFISGVPGHDVLLHSLTADIDPVPEPTSLAVLGIGLLGLGLTRRRFRVH